MRHLILNPEDNMRVSLRIRFNHTMLDGYTIFFAILIFLALNHPISAHRSPDNAHGYVQTKIDCYLRCIIVNTTLPILGIPSTSKYLKGRNSLLSTMQKGIPIATFAIGKLDAANAGLFAVSLLALSDPKMAAKIDYSRKTRG